MRSDDDASGTSAEGAETGLVSAEVTDDVPLTLSTYSRLRGLEAPRVRRRRRRNDDDENQPFTKGRDPRGLGDALSDLTREAGWDSRLAREDLLLRWVDVAGEETAEHAQPVGLQEGTLTVQCDSTTWARQLNMLRGEILTRILHAYPEAGIETVRFIGPDVPSWKWGRRTVPGRGPRDTYG